MAELGAANEQLEKAAKKKGVDPTLEPRLKELQEKLTQRAEIEAALNTEVSRLKEEALEAEQRCVLLRSQYSLPTCGSSPLP